MPTYHLAFRPFLLGCLLLPLPFSTWLSFWEPAFPSAVHGISFHGCVVMMSNQFHCLLVRWYSTRALLTPAYVGVGPRLNCTCNRDDGVSVFIRLLFNVRSPKSLLGDNGIFGSVGCPTLEFVNRLSAAQVWFHYPFSGVPSSCYQQLARISSAFFDVHQIHIGPQRSE